MADPAHTAVAAPSAQAVAAFELEAYIPGDRRRALAQGVAMSNRVRGAGLFADISGFTPLMETFARELGPQRGAEELTAHVNRVFHALISELDRFGGHVIYFSGDAITGWIDEDDGARATACALSMQETMNDLREVVTLQGSRVRLALKTAVAVGTARRFVVGDPDIQLIDVLAGRLVDALAVAERNAESGEVVLASSARDSLGDRVVIREQRVDEATRDGCAIVDSLRDRIAATQGASSETALPPAVVKQWLLPAIHDRVSTGRGEFLAELRPAIPLFVRFGGIDYDLDDDAAGKLDNFVRHAQRIATAYGGNLLHLTLGDKGAYLSLVFGSPHAHEDDAARAAAAALDLRDLSSVTAAVDIQIGIAHGRLWSGMYGHARRQTFTCFGDAVNLAARLMSSAPPAAIYVDESLRRIAGDGFEWEALAPIHLKGKTDPQPVCALSGSKRHAQRGGTAPPRSMVGRTRELGVLNARLDEVLSGKGRLIGLAGEAGIGKSRLIAEFVTAAEQCGLELAVGECQSYGRNVSYFVWREIWSTLFGLDDGTPEEERIRRLESELAAVDPKLVARAPLLSVLLDLPIRENDLTASLDAKLRKASLEGLLVECLQAKARAAPLMLVLEDGHWIDPLSRDLLDVIARVAPSLRVLIVLAYRPDTDVGGRGRFTTLPNLEEVALAELDLPETVALIRSKLEQMIDAEAEPPSALVEIITARAQGNPFYVEELFNYIRSRGVDPRDERALKKLELPESLQSLILSRIDTLDEAPRQTLKVASVLGRVFRASMLPGVYSDLGGIDAVRSHLRTLGDADLVKGDERADETYFFKHFVTREVAYGSMPFGFRSMLHERVGHYIEETESDAVDRHLDVLAHHYWYSDNREKKREYLGRAGIAAQASYANAIAIDYFERLTPLLSKGSRLDMLLKLGKVHELVGNWNRAEEVDRDAMALAEELDDGLRRASCHLALAEVVRKQGRYDEALELLNQAARGFAAFGEEGGVASVSHLVGTVFAQRGNYDTALEHYNKSLRIRERIGDKAGMASLYSNLGIIEEYRGNYDASKAFHERALELRESVGERWAIGNSMNNLGMIAALQKRFEEARDWFSKSMLANREVGDNWMVGMCHNNLGNATRGMGDYAAARAHYADSLRAYRDYEDRWALAFLIEDIGMLASLSGDSSAAFELVGSADAIRKDIGAPRAPSLAQDLEGQLETVAAGMSDDERAAIREKGRSMDVVATIERALEVCTGARSRS